MSESACRICGNRQRIQSFSFPDYHLGLPDRFSYFQCGECGCLQKKDLKEETSKFYPEDYYSFSYDYRTTVGSKIKWAIRDIRNEYYRTSRGKLGALIHQILPCASVQMIAKVNPPKDWHILDVGCGSDALMLQYLASQGYEHLTGIDPYISNDMIELGPITIYKKELCDLSNGYDLITFNHSFEHIADQKKNLQHSRDLLKPSGKILMRIPTVSSYAWERYGELWPNLDAPRHLFLHSIRSLTLLAEQSGLTVEARYYDSTSFQFWGKKLYEKGLPLNSKKPMHRIIQAAFRLFYSLLYYKKVKQLNESSQGDTVALILKRK
ncbi:MAG: class I SAM-dependent methyltransferase [Chitinivibrionales bacterium]